MKKHLTEVVFILDRSGSMRGLEADTIGGFNSMIEKQKKTEALKAELKTLSADIEPEVLKKYEIKRSERIFPIICALNGDRCSKCGMELSLVGKEKIATKEVIECENCHRFLYK